MGMTIESGMENKSVNLILESIDAIFDQPPVLEKIPGCPDGFVWRDESFRVSRLISEWHDYRRRGKMGRNMRPSHAVVAAGRGSWGVGQDFYLVETDDGRFFVIYYDRAPKGLDQRKGEWFVEREYIDQGKEK